MGNLTKYVFFLFANGMFKVFICTKGKLVWLYNTTCTDVSALGMKIVLKSLKICKEMNGCKKCG